MDSVGRVPAELEDVDDALDKALQVDWDLLDEQDRRASLLALTRIVNKANALDARVVAVADDPVVFASGPEGGSATLNAWIKKHSNVHPGASAGRVVRADRLHRMPVVREAFETGTITTDHVRLLGELTRRDL